MDLANPWALSLLLPWCAAAWRALRPARAPGAPLAGATARLGALRPTWRQRLCRLLPPLFLLGALLLILGAAGPRRALGRVDRGADALAVMMAVDVSGSMRGLDLGGEALQDTRLDVVKRLFRRFVESRPDDLVGLVAFGGYASCRAPLTADHAALLHTLAGLRIPPEGAQDELLTAIGDGLALALQRLKDAEPKNKIVILLSDGANTAGAVSPAEAAQAAAALGVRVYAVGVGSEGPVPVRVRDPLGRERLATARMDLDEATLKALAEKTGGRYANVRSPRDLEAFLADVAALETTRVDRRVHVRHESLAGGWLLAGGALCLAAAAAHLLLLRRPV